MLVLSRRADESIYIELDPNTPPDMTVAEFFRHGPIKVTVLASGISFARIGVLAPQGLRILRSELLDDQDDQNPA